VLNVEDLLGDDILSIISYFWHKVWQRKLAYVLILASIYWSGAIAIGIIAVGNVNPDAAPMPNIEKWLILRIWQIYLFPLGYVAGAGPVFRVLLRLRVDPEGWEIIGLNGLLWGYLIMRIANAIKKI
jgi:hypothetical protein